MANQNYEQHTKTTGFDPLSIEEKMKKFRFAKPAIEGPKDVNWFKNINNDYKSPKEPIIKTTTT